MAISWVGAGALVAATSTPQTFTLPASTATNDFLVLTAAVDATGGSAVTSTDYTSLASLLATGPTPDIQLTLLRKIHDGTEPNPSVAASLGASNGFFGFASAFRGVDTTTPLDGVTPNTSESAGSVASYTPANITTATAEAWVVSVVATDNQATLELVVGSEQGFTTRISGSTYSSATGSDCAFGVATKLAVTAGAVTLPTWRNVTANSRFAAVTYVLRPSASGGAAVDSQVVQVQKTGTGMQTALAVKCGKGSTWVTV